MPTALEHIPAVRRYILACGSSQLARLTAVDLAKLAHAGVWVLGDGTAAQVAADLSVEAGETRLTSDRIDCYHRPYEDAGVPRIAIQTYLDRKFGLVKQLWRDRTHGLRVI